MKILFAGGGTAGHINPALSIANYIKSKEENFEAMFIGTEHGLEKKLVPAAGYEIKYIDICGFDRERIFRNAGVIHKLNRSIKDCKKIIDEFRPDAVVCTGGYVSGPVAMAAKAKNIPAMIHEQNVYPGLAVKGSERSVNCVAVSFDETVSHMRFPKKCVVTGNPIREELLLADKAAARAELGLGDKPFVLVFGGSLGAKRINDAMIDVLEKISKDGRISVLFGTGDRNYKEVSEALEKKNIKSDGDVKVVPYINNMSTVMAACYVVVSRAGAITVSEIAALGKASILIPSPNVVRNHQEQNAREFEKNGAAVLITEAELTSELLYEKIKELAENETLRTEMSENVKKIAKTDALEKIYDIVKGFVK